MFTDNTTHATDGVPTLDHLYASTAAEAVRDSIADDIADRIAIADEIEVDVIIREARCDHTNGRLTVDDLDFIEEAAQTRKADLAEATRAARRRTRQHLHEPRPATSPEDRIRLRRWHARIKADRLAGHIGSSYDAYLHEVAACRSVAQGNWCLYSDEELGQRINVSGRTVRRHRAAALKRKHLEARGRGKDRKTNAVRMILQDGLPVYLSRSEKAGQSATSVRLTRPTLADELSSTEALRTEEPPPSPPAAVPDEPDEGRGVLDDREAADPQAPTPIDVPKRAAEEEVGLQPRQEATERPAARRAARQPTRDETAPAGSAAAKLFPGLWAAAAVGRTERETGPKGVALAACLRLSQADTAKLMEVVSRPGFRPPSGVWVGTWLKGGPAVWEEAAPVAAADASRLACPAQPPRPAPAATDADKARVAAALESYRRGRARSNEAAGTFGMTQRAEP